MGRGHLSGGQQGAITAEAILYGRTGARAKDRASFNGRHQDFIFGLSKGDKVVLRVNQMLLQDLDTEDGNQNDSVIKNLTKLLGDSETKYLEVQMDQKIQKRESADEVTSEDELSLSGPEIGEDFIVFATDLVATS